MEGLGVVFDTQPRRSSTSMREEIHAQVEVDRQIVGRGVGLTSDEAKELAADRVLVALQSMLGPFPHKRQGSSSWKTDARTGEQTNEDRVPERYAADAFGQIQEISSLYTLKDEISSRLHRQQL